MVVEVNRRPKIDRARPLSCNIGTFVIFSEVIDSKERNQTKSVPMDLVALENVTHQLRVISRHRDVIKAFVYPGDVFV